MLARKVGEAVPAMAVKPGPRMMELPERKVTLALPPTLKPLAAVMELVAV